MNGSSPFLNLCFTRGSKHDLNKTAREIVNSGESLNNANDAQLAIYNMPNDNITRILLTLHTHFGSIVLLFLCSRKKETIKVLPQVGVKEDV